MLLLRSKRMWGTLVSGRGEARLRLAENDFVVGLTWIVFVLTAMQGAMASTLQLGVPTVEENRCHVPVFLSGAEGVAALNFQLHYDPELITPQTALPGAALLSAGKDLRDNAPAPGIWVLVAMGLNQTVVLNGEIAHLVLQMHPQSVASSAVLELTNPTLADSQGNELSVTGSAVQIPLSVSPENEEEGETTTRQEAEKDSNDTAKETGQDTEKPASSVVNSVTTTTRARRDVTISDAHESGIGQGKVATPTSADQAEASISTHTDVSAEQIEQLRKRIKTSAASGQRENTKPESASSVAKHNEHVPSGTAIIARDSVEWTLQDKKFESKDNEESQTVAKTPVTSSAGADDVKKRNQMLLIIAAGVLVVLVALGVFQNMRR